MRVRGGLGAPRAAVRAPRACERRGSHPTSARDHGAAFRQDPAHAGAALPERGRAEGPARAALAWGSVAALSPR